MPQDPDMNKKLDKILMNMDSFDKKLDTLEKKIEDRLSKVENQCLLFQKKSNKQEKRQDYILNEVSKLKETVNVMEQEKLERNIIIKGIKEVENDDNQLLGFMVDGVLDSLEDTFESSNVVNVRRIGAKKPNLPRLILVELSCKEIKLKIMQKLKDSDLNCSKFNNNGVAWGSQADKIYISDHLTPTNSKIFYQARKLKKCSKIKYAWSKFGQIYVKKDDDSRAYHMKSIEQLLYYEKQSLNKEDEDTDESFSSESHSEVEDESNGNGNTEAEMVSDAQQSESNRKRNRSKEVPTKSPKKSPRPKRTKSTRHK